ncbi:MAG: YdcF family protein [Methyloligellaceae bacterium]
MQRLARAMKVLAWTVGLAAGVFVLGFLFFAHSINGTNIAVGKEQADGIVVLTGAQSRIAEALTLLAAGKGQRLLITGVYPATKRKALKKIAPKHGPLFECCIDIDHIALNTIGNAKAVRDWATAKDFRSVIVVTSDYHMPRSLVELRRALPSLKLVAYPVTHDSLRVNAWWTHSGTTRLLISEYMKLIPAVARYCVSELGRRIIGPTAMRPSMTRSPS